MSAQDRVSAPSRLPTTSPVATSFAPPAALARPPTGPSPTGHQTATYFDLDRTILTTSSAQALGTSMRRNDLVSSRALAYRLITQILYFLVGAGTQHSSSLMEHLALISTGISRRDLMETVEGALATAIEPAVCAEALDPIEDHRRVGYDVVMISTSISEVVAPIACLVGADRVMATHMEVSEDGLFTRCTSRFMLHSEKMVALHEDAATHDINPVWCWAYFDSISDELILNAVGHPVAVNPNRDLQRLAQERDRPVRDSAYPVRL